MRARVLLVEDDRILRKAADATLRKHGYQVSVAVDGEEALAKAMDEKPDLILLDIIMPKIQGFEVLRRLKANVDTAAIPVVMLSNLGQETDRQEALLGGALAFLVKSNMGLDRLAAEVDAILASPTQ